MDISDWALIGLGLVVGTGAAFTGLGGGFLIIPILLFLGFTSQRAVGTSFVAILVIALSALVAHHKFNNIDMKAGLLLGIGGLVGAQLGARFLEHVSTAQFRRIFAFVLIALAVYLLVKK
ncbi:MAG TPA: sulfite exporter TauE/SafE family protein [Kiritimatiellia bacterium]|nr:sulfite exporter TauE/SafE family protein [Kiritimatiellia bacterium]